MRFKWERVVLCMVALAMMTGCEWLSRQIVGTQDTRVPTEVLEHNETMAGKGITFYTTALTKIGDEKNKEVNKSVLKLANLVDDELRRTVKASEESKVAMIGNTAVRILAQPEIQRKVEEGVEWSKNMITAVAGGATGGTGLFGTMLFRMIRGRRRIATEVKKNMIKTKVISEHPDVLAAVKKAAEHTGLEGIIT